MELTASAIAATASGRIAAGGADVVARSYATDSRRIEPGGCFFALAGDRDGHAFVGDAVARGATVLVVRDPDVAAGAATVVQVEDPFAALRALAVVARTRLGAAHVVGVTGSAGKTATKDLLAAALARHAAVHASPESFNNEAGVPLTLLGAPLGTAIVVAEMGARFAGNLTELAALARPDVAVVTNIGLAHAEHLGGREGVARVKGELVAALPADGLAVLNADCDATPGLAARTTARVITAGRGPDADVRASAVVLDDELRPGFRLDSPWGSGDVRLSVRGEHQVANSVLAGATALALGAPIDGVLAGLGDATGATHRMQLRRTHDGIVVLDDSYNSSPTSAAAAVRALARLRVPGRHVAVLGDMLELGTHGDAAHDEIGALAGAEGIDLVVAVGACREQLAAGARRARVQVVTVPDAAAATVAVAEHVHPGDAVLVKASRAVGLDTVADAILADVIGAGSVAP